MDKVAAGSNLPPMRILDRYIGREFLISTLIAVIVLSGVHVLGRVIEEPELRLPDTEPISVEALADAFNRIVVPDPLGASE